MEIIEINVHQQIQLKDTHVACIGYFDGVHLGHQKLIESVVKLSKQNQCVPTCICFDQDPWIVSKKISYCQHLTTLENRLNIMQNLGIKKCFLLHFDEEMMRLKKEQFISTILNHLQLHTLVCGEDFTFANQREGKVIDLENQSFSLNVVPEFRVNQRKISSSYIEKIIIDGKIKEANSLLGRLYSLQGKVVHGAHIGTTQLGFPTANLALSKELIIPKKGVYIGKVRWIEKEYWAMINIGFNPTLNKRDTISIEAYLLDFNQDIYGENVTFCFIDFLREEKKFSNKNALIEQLLKDIEVVKQYRREV